MINQEESFKAYRTTEGIIHLDKHTFHQKRCRGRPDRKEKGKRDQTRQRRNQVNAIAHA